MLHLYRMCSSYNCDVMYNADDVIIRLRGVRESSELLISLKALVTQCHVSC